MPDTADEGPAGPYGAPPIEDRAAAQASWLHLQRLLDHLPGMAYRCRNDDSWTMELVSAGCLELTGHPPEALLEGRVSYASLVHPDDLPAVRREVAKALAEQRPFTLRYRLRDAAGVEKFAWERGAVVPASQSEAPCLEGFVTDITPLHRAEYDLGERRKELRCLYEARALLDAPGPAPWAAVVALLAPAMRWPHEVVAQLVLGDARYGSDDAALYEAAAPRLEAPVRAEGKPAGALRLARAARTSEAPDEGYFLEEERELVEAIAERVARRLEADALAARQRSLEEQLRQAQKLEAIGRLARGIAHDFNNLLTVINSYASILLLDTPSDHPARADLSELRGASEQAGRLTRQLLTFAQRQVLQPVLLDLNELVRGLASLLRRALGDDVVLGLTLASNLWGVRADPSQLEQVLMNLAVNARDAMPQGGRLSVETENVRVDDDYARAHLDVPAGDYVVLAVTDTGQGIDAQTREHLFEPFFTTKAPGKGTGLGLSIVYGIARQSGGAVHVYSEPARGATFRVYLPRAEPGGHEPASAPAVAVPARDHETVLVVEDAPSVRAVVSRVLTDAGYQVLLAASGGEALMIAERHAGVIDLLLVDLVMPWMSGGELAERLGAQRPGLRVLYTSGYARAAALDRGALPRGAHFLAKPFGAAELTTRVREALEAPAAR